MTRAGRLQRHFPFLVLMGSLLLAAYYVDRYLEGFTYILINSRLIFQLFVGVTVIACLKNVVGIRTFGTFAPAIIALAFLQAGFIFATVLLLDVLAMVVATRELIRRELVQQDHRVAILVITVGLSIVGMEVLAEYFHYPQLDYTFLFPMLILAWLSERFVEEIDRVGWESPSRRLLATFVTIVIAYGAMVQVWLVDMIILNPFTWSLLILANWYLGTQVRFRVLEHRRFRALRARLAPGPRGEVLTMNVRNREFIAQYNDPQLASHLTKANTKAILESHGVPIPRTFMVLQRREDLAGLEAFLRTAETFVVKPASGHGGEGILVVRGRGGQEFRTSHGPMSAPEVVAHAQYILTGAFGEDSGDQALVEELVEGHPALRTVVPEGLADIRIIAFRGFPVMAMVRLPTQESKGRANLHAGAVGCGIDLRTGRIFRATWHGRPVGRHPDTRHPLVGFEVPFWPQVLEIACQAQVATGLGYAGVDVVLDARQGPLVLEVNRRPGLEIQNANLAGLLGRLRALEGVGPGTEVEQSIRVALELDAHGWEVAR